MSSYQILQIISRPVTTQCNVIYKLLVYADCKMTRKISKSAIKKYSLILLVESSDMEFPL